MIGEKSDPVINDKLWIAYAGGLASYTSGAASVDNMGIGSGSGTALDISDDGQTIMVVVGNQVYTSTDGGASWADRSGNGFGEIPSGSRIEVALSKDMPNNMYAVVVTGGGGTLRGVYSSSDSGQTFYEIAPSSNGGTEPFSPFVSLAGQGVYNCALVVVPGQPDRCILGGIRLHKYSQAQSFPPAGQWSDLNQNFSNVPSLNYVHSDIHTFHFDANGVFYIGCDGGIFKSNDNGDTFFSQNFNYRTTQYYGMGYNYKGHMIGGTQDNGTHVLTGFGITPNAGEQVRGGDGFDCEMSQYDPGFAIASIYNNAISRSFDGGSSFQAFMNEYDTPGPFFTTLGLYETHFDEESTDIVPIFVTTTDETEQVTGDTMSYYNPILTGDSLTYLSGNYGIEFSTVAEYDVPFWDTMTVFENGVVIDFIDTTTVTQMDSLTITVYDPIDTMIWIVVDNDSTFFHLVDSIPMMVDTVITTVTTTIDTFYVDGQIPVLDSTLVLFYGAPDYARSLFAAGGFGEFWMSRDVTKSLTSNVELANISGNGFGGTPTCFEFSEDGDVLYVGTNPSRVFRITGLRQASTAAELELIAGSTMTQIYSGSGAIRDLSLDPNDQSKLAICKAGYGTNDKVLVSTSALTAPNTTNTEGTFEGAWGMPADLERMPCYSILFDKNNPGRMIAGTEYGTWLSDDEGDSWTECNLGMGRVPVYDLRQQIKTVDDNPNMLNEGTLYAGSFGRGLFYDGGYILSVDDVVDSPQSPLSDLRIYPNPMNISGNVNLNLTREADVTIEIFDINGKLVMSSHRGQLNRGEQSLQFDVDQLRNGTYILNVIMDEYNETGRFVIMN
jgi:hypothetical protein